MLIFLIPDTLVCDEGGHVLIKAHYWTMRNIRLHSGPIAINSTKCPPNIGYSYDKIINPSKSWLKHQRNSFKREPKCSHQFNDNLFFSLKSFRVWSGMLFLGLHSLWRIRHQSESQGDTNFYQWLDFYVHVGFSSLNGTHLLENSKYDCYGEKGLYALTV